MNKFFNEMWKLVLENNVDETDVEELLLARLSALTRLYEVDEAERRISMDFLKRTAVSHDFNYDAYRNLSRYKTPIITAKRISDDVNALVYKIQGESCDELHEIALFEKLPDGRYVFSRKEDLSALYREYCSEVQVDNDIRQIGDPVLHAEARDVLDFSDDGRGEIENQLNVLKLNLIKTGGVGIAANQCGEIEAPWKIILSGVDYHSPEHIIKAVTRYQTALFPSMKVLINPVIVDQDEEMSEFTEGCLSVRGSARGVVKRPKSVTVRYQDIKGNYHQESYVGTDARVMLHELDHILNGYVYIQRLIDELTQPQRLLLKSIIQNCLSHSSASVKSHTFGLPITIFVRDTHGQVVFDEKIATEAFAKLSVDTLSGMLTKL